MPGLLSQPGRASAAPVARGEAPRRRRAVPCPGFAADAGASWLGSGRGSASDCRGQHASEEKCEE